MSLLRTVSKKERFVWMSITIGLLAFILLVSLAPSVLAQNPEGDDIQALKKFNEIYYYIKDHYVDIEKTDATRLIDGALNGLLKSLDDPHSSYLTGDAVKELKESTYGTYAGVGIIISKQRLLDDKGELLENTPVEAVAPIEGTPAYRAGILAGDLIIKVNNESTNELNLDEVARKMRGPSGTSVTLTILRSGTIEFDVTLTRAIINLPSMKSAIINKKTGYIKITEFNENTPGLVGKALDDMEKQGISSLIIDLRNNPGGILGTVVEIADYFLSEGTIVSIRGRAIDQNYVYRAKKRNDRLSASVPIVVLIDQGSASASEILAGALKDNNRATIIGEKSYGKGTVQTVSFMRDSAVRVTVARYFRPNGTMVDKIGIAPDIEMKEPEYSKSELESYNKLIKENIILDFILHNPNPSERQITQFMKSLKKKGIVLRDSILRRLILAEKYRKMTNPPIYDLQSDAVLKKAVEVLKSKIR